jgi:hypothetical protein
MTSTEKTTHRFRNLASGRLVRAAVCAAAALALGWGTVVVPDVPTAEARSVTTASRRGSGSVCGFDAQTGFIARILTRRGIPLPVIESTPGIAHAAQYVVGGPIQIRDRCVSGSVLAHETGHYVHLLAIGSFGAAVADAEANFAGTWMRNGQYPGLERAAHCVGNVLWGYGPYTRCPVRASWLHANHLVWYAGQPR